MPACCRADQAKAIQNATNEVFRLSMPSGATRVQIPIPLYFTYLARLKLLPTPIVALNLNIIGSVSSHLHVCMHF